MKPACFGTASTNCLADMSKEWVLVVEAEGKMGVRVSPIKKR